MIHGSPILIVEDCEDAVPALQIALESCYDSPVQHFADGALALSHLHAYPEIPLAIITDLNLPVIDGFELIARVRESKLWSHVPIIVVSADPNPRTPARAREAGADAFFSKPYSPAAICTCLERILHEKNDHDKNHHETLLAKDGPSTDSAASDPHFPGPTGRAGRD